MPPRSMAHVRMRRYLWRVVEVACLLLLLAIIFLLFGLALHYILPFVIGWFLALVLLPLVRTLEHKGVKRVMAVSLVIGVLAGAAIVVFLYAALSVFREAIQFSASASFYFSQINLWVKARIAAGQEVFGDLPPRVAKAIESALRSGLTTAQSMIQHIVRTLIHSVTHLPETLFIVVISVIAAFVILMHRERMFRSFLNALPPGWSRKVTGVVHDVTRAFFGTVRAQLLLMMMSAVLGTIGIKIIGAPYAVLLGILFGIAGIIPLVGSALVTIPWALGAFMFGDVTLALKVLLLQAVISLIRHLVEPKILADNVGLDLLPTLFGLYVGMQALGVVGLFLGPIFLIGIKSLLRARMFSDFLPEVALPTDVEEEGMRE